MKIQSVLVILWLSELYCHPSRPHVSRPQQFKLKEQFYWDIPDFQFPNVSARKVALSTGSYIPKNNNIWSIRVWGDKMFASVFRFGTGIASSLNYFSLKSASKSPVLIPYPSFDANYVNEDPLHKTMTLPSNSSIISTAYFSIDKCDRLWALDTGFIDFYSQAPRRTFTPPALVIFDLKKNVLLFRYTIPAKFVTTTTDFVNLDIDFEGRGCDNAYAYMVDSFQSIVVYSLKKNRSWRITHNLFGSDPHFGVFHYEGRNIEMNVGALGITIGDRYHDGSRRVYINPFASTKSYYISNKILQNEAYIKQNEYYNDVHFLGDRGKNGQIYTWAYDDKTKVLFDTQFYRQRIGCWDTRNPFGTSSFGIIYKSSNISFFPDDIYIDKSRNLWLIDNKLPTFLFGSWQANTKNIQIYKAKVDDVISGTVCKHK